MSSRMPPRSPPEEHESSSTPLPSGRVERAHQAPCPGRWRCRPFLLRAALAAVLGLGAGATRCAYRRMGPPALWRSVLESSRAGDDMKALASARRLIDRYPLSYEANLARFLEAVVRITVGDPGAQGAFRVACESALQHPPDQQRPERRLALLRCALAGSLLAGPDIAVVFPGAAARSGDLGLIPPSFLDPSPVRRECDFALAHQAAMLCLKEGTGESLTGTDRAFIRDLARLTHAVAAAGVDDGAFASGHQPRGSARTESIQGRVLFESDPAAGVAIALRQAGAEDDLAWFAEATFRDVLDAARADEFRSARPRLMGIARTDENGRYAVRPPCPTAAALVPQVWASHRQLDPDWPVYDFVLDSGASAATAGPLTIHVSRAPYLTCGASPDYELIAGTPPTIIARLHLPPTSDPSCSGWRLRARLARVQPLDPLPVSDPIFDATIEWPDTADTLDVMRSFPGLLAHLQAGDPCVLRLSATREIGHAGPDRNLQACDLVRWTELTRARPLHEELLALALALRVLEEPKGDPAELLAAALAPLPESALRAYYCCYLAHALAPRQPERVRQWIGQIHPPLDPRSHWTEQLMLLRNELAGINTPSRID